MVRQKLPAASLAVFTIAAALAGACAGAEQGRGASVKSPFPVTIRAANGKVTLQKRPVRIVSLSPTATEDLFAIGAGKQVVAVDDQSNYPARAPRTKLSGYTPNPEAVAGYKPDLVVASFDANGLLRALKRLRVPVLLEPSAANLAGAYAQLRQLGLATGHRRGAAALVMRMRARIAKSVRSVPKPAKPLSAYHELSPDYYSATSKTFIGQAYRLFGLRNIADAANKTGSRYPQLSGEYIVAQSPDLIVLADTKCCHQTPASVAARPGWGQISAVKHGGVVGVSDDIASRWGPRIVNFIRLIAVKVKAAEAASGGR
jgi:ABC-type Fe3+-hydroxamate transport system substrate-binding protein